MADALEIETALTTYVARHSWATIQRQLGSPKAAISEGMGHKGFIGTVNYSANDHVFFGKIEGINDLVTFEGTTVEELESAFKEMVDLHIEDCKREGKTVEKSYKGSFNVRISSELHKKAAQIAAAKGINLNQLVKHALKRELHEEQEAD